MRRTVISLFAMSVFVACGSDDPTATPAPPDGGTISPPSDAGSDGAPSDAASTLDATEAGDASDAATCTPPSAPPRVLFLNKGGGVYTPGPDDSRTNVSSIPDVTITANAWTVSAPAWTAIVDCVKQKLSPFNVTVTDVDPGATQQHVEVVFAQNTPTIFNGAASVGPLACVVKENAIAFVSQPHAEANATNGCAAAAQLYGFAMGLEQVVSCSDAMTFDYTACTTAAFTSTALDCGSNTAGNCKCGAGTTQKSFDKMLAVLGPRCL